MNWTNSMRLTVGVMFAALQALIAAGAQAQTENYSYIQGMVPRAEEATTTHGPDILGHKVNLYTGALEFEHTDIELPGNSTLRVAFSRKHVGGLLRPNGLLGNWSIEVPRVGGNFSNSRGWVTQSGTTARCTGFSSPPYIGFVNAYQYWQGTHLTVPGKGGGELLPRTPANSSTPTDGYSYPLVTRDHWQVRCLASIQNAAGEGFVARSPDGEEYRFDWMATRSMSAVKEQTTTVARSEYMLMATQVTDRFGNWVRYAYDAANPRRLTGITSNDGRAITVAYGANGLVSSVNDGTRTWTYSYGSGTPNTGIELSVVTLPDTSRWELSLTPLVHPISVELGEAATCGYPGA